ERFRAIRPEPVGKPLIPRSPAYYAEQITFVDTAAGATALVDLAQQRPLTCIGFDTEFRYATPGVRIDSKHVAYDPHSLEPLLLSLALLEPVQGQSWRCCRFVVDLRVQELLPALRTLLQLPVCFAGHYAHAELLCLLRLG